MKKTVLAFALTLLSIQLSAQQDTGTFSIIPRLGVSLSDLSHDEIFFADEEKGIGSRNKAGLLAGAEVEYQATTAISVSAGVLYSQQGNRFPDHETGDGKNYSGFRNFHTTLHYLNVPLTVNAYVLPNFAIRTGVQVGALLGAQNKSEITDFVKNEDGSKTYGTTEERKATFTDLCNKVDVSIPIGVSYEYMNVILDARYNIGLTRLYSNKTLDQRNRCITITAGYRFALR